MSHTLWLRQLLLTLGFLVLSLASAQAQGAFDITPVARSGDPVRAPAKLVSASEPPSGTTPRIVPRLSDTGEVLFRGDGGLLLASPEGHVVIAAPGDRTPDGRLIVAIGDASVNAEGEVAFVALLDSLAPPPVPPVASALLLFSDGTIAAIAQSGDPAPGGGTFGRFGGVALNAHGHVAFVSGGQGAVLYLYAGGAIRELVRASDPAFGGANIFSDSVRINDAGQVAVATAFAVDAKQSTPRGVFLITHGEVIPIATPGMAAPGGGTFSRAESPSINARGDVAFAGNFSSLPVPPFALSGIFVFSNGALTQVASAGDVVGEHTLNATGSPTIDALGQIAFQASVAPSSAIFLWSGGLVRLLVGPGSQTHEGEILSSAAGPWLNASGQLAFADDRGPFGSVYRLTDEAISRVAGLGDVVRATPRIVSASTLEVRSAGQPVFVATIFPGQTGVFDVTGALRARIGDEAPGGGVMTTFSEVTSSGTGFVAFIASLSTGGSGLFISHEGRLLEIVRTGAPGPDGGTFAQIWRPSVNASGDVAFLASLGPGQSAIFLASHGTIELLVRRGVLSPDGEPLTPDSSGTGVSLNDKGQVAFAASPAGAPLPFRPGVFLFSGETLITVVRNGDPAPGGGTFGFLFGFELIAAGQVAFQSNVAGAGDGILLFTPGDGIRSLVRPGDPAPGGGTFSSVGGPGGPSMNAVGDVAFSSRRSGVPLPNNPGLFLLSEGELQIIAQSGDPAPGGAMFTWIEYPKVGTGGQILFTGTTSPVDSAAYPTGVFLASRPAPQLQVHIDIRPAGAANRINPASDRSVPVAILSDEAFDATTVAADTVRFGPTGTEATPTLVAIRDVDGDSDVDVMVRFRIADTGIQCGQTSALLTGRTSDGRTFAASDAIQTVRCP